MKRFNANEEKKICEDFQSGESIRRLSILYKAQRRTIRLVLLKNNIEVKSRTKNFLGDVTEDTQIEIKKDLLSLELHTSEIAKKYNLPIRTIFNIATKFNITKWKKVKNGMIIDFMKEDINYIISNYGKTENLISLSKKYNCSRPVIENILIKNNVISENKSKRIVYRKRNLFLNSIEKDIVKMYQTLAKIEEIIKEFKISYWKIVEILQKHGVQLRKRGFFSEGIPSRGITGWYNNYFFRSLNELSFIINYLERKNIKAIGEGNGKVIPIDYFDNLKNKNRVYYPDFLTENGFLIEIKPKEFWTDSIVQLKAKAGQEFANKNNLKYRLVNYPVIIGPILEKVKQKRIKFSPGNYKKFRRNLHRFLD